MRKTRSSSIPFGLAYGSRKAMLKACGYSEEELGRPLIGIMNQWSEAHPGHIHLRKIANSVKKGVIQAGGTPMEVNTLGLCDGVIMPVWRFTLPHRDLIVLSIEVAAEANLFDGMVLLASCDKNVPAALMAAARVNIPSILVTGGYMLPGFYKGRTFSMSDREEALALVSFSHEMDKSDYDNLTVAWYCSAGVCPIMTTGQTFCQVSEALGMSMPGNATAFAEGASILRIARNAGKQAMYLFDKNIRPRDIITQKSIENAIKVCLAIGGSIHSTYHIPAICVEAGMDLDVRSMFDEFSRDIPQLVRIQPNGDHNVMDFDRAGGLRALMKNLSEKLSLDVMTVTGRTLGENIEDAEVFDESVIHTLDSPAAREGGIGILKGNIAEEGGVLRVSGVSERILKKGKFSGKARVFFSEEEAIEALRSKGIEEGSVIVIPYQGLRGAPGIRTLLPLTGEIHGMHLEEKLAVVTDGRLSGAAHGLSIGLVCPEAADGGGIAVVRDGDIIDIDIPGRKINLRIKDKELQKRREEWVPPPKKPLDSVYLSIYQQVVQPLTKGAVLGDPSIRKRVGK